MMNRETGRSLSGWPHVVQSLAVLFTTRLGEREMRRWAGSLAPAMLGETINQANVLRFTSAITVAVELWEPRYAVARVVVLDLTRDGRLGFRIDGEYRPRGLLGDPTPEGTRSIFLGPNGALAA